MLTDLKIRSLTPADKAYKQYDQRGLYLEKDRTDRYRSRPTVSVIGRCFVTRLPQGVPSATRRPTCVACSAPPEPVITLR